jgi:hypothetical protein
MERRSSPRFIESTAGQVVAELLRLGVAPDERVTILLATDDLVQGGASPACASLSPD